MIRELLLALLGNPGSLIREKEGHGFLLDESFSAVLSTEREFINKIAHFGFCYSTLNRHVQSVLFPSSPLVKRKQGDYHHALCCAIENILSHYRQQILDFEQIYLRTPPLTVSFIYATLSKCFAVVLNSLCNLIHSLKENGTHGCMIFTLLRSYETCGNPCISHYFSHLRQYCLRVFVLQLEGWLSLGIIRDPFEEFLISSQNFSDSDSDNTPKSISFDFLWDTRFSVRHSQVPYFLDQQAAEEILFCGKAVGLLCGESFLQNSSLSLENHGSELYKDVLGLKNQMGKLLLRLHLLKNPKSLTQYQVVEASELGKSRSFPLESVSLVLEETIFLVKKCLSAHLYRYVVESAQFVSHLKTCYDIFLFGRANVFNHFLSAASQLFLQPLTVDVGVDLNLAFSRSLLLCQTTEEDNYSQFQLRVSPSQQPNQRSTLQFHYSAPWPIHILLSPQTIAKYNQIFWILMQLHNAKNWLNEAWTLISFNRKALTTQDRKRRTVLHTASCLRSQISFFLGTIMNQLQTQLIDLGFSELLSQIKSTEDFHEVKASHERFLANIFRFPFLSQAAFVRCLENIVAQTPRLSIFLKEKFKSEGAGEAVQKMTREFQRQVQLTLELLINFEKKSGGLSGALCRQLVTQLMFNRYFSI